MTLLALGINHKSASVELREKVAFTPNTLACALQKFSSETGAQEVVIISTCNRTEIYVYSTNIDPCIIQEWLANFHSIELQTVKQHSYVLLETDAVEHVMRVACGLDSLIMGEPQILGQVKQAFNEAKSAGSVGSQFEKLFQSTFSVAKKVRTHTEIGANAVSVAFASVQLAKQIFSSLQKSEVLLIGAGETIELVAKHIHQQQPQSITVANRTLINAQKVAEPLQAQSITISQIPEHLTHADIVISSTASLLPLIGKGMVENALKSRKHKPMLLIDLAVPRDVESEVGQLDDAYLYTVDDLQNIVEQNMANRELAASQAKSIIDSQVVEFRMWQQHYKHTDMIKIYRDNQVNARDNAVHKALKQLKDGSEPEQVIQDLAFKLTQNMMHGPTRAIKQASENNNKAVMSMLVEAFRLDVVRPNKTGK